MPVGILIPSFMAKSDAASTAAYSLASSPLFLHGHIQFALSEMALIPFANGANTMLVRDSAIANLLPACGFMSATAGACPNAVAIP